MIHISQARVVFTKDAVIVSLKMSSLQLVDMIINASPGISITQSLCS